MNKIIYILIIITVMTKLVFAQKKKAFLVSPINKGIGLRSNFNKKNFWDWKLSYHVGVSPAGAVYNFSPEISWKHRTINKEFVKFYWGIGGLVEYVVPSVIVPIGFEVIPFEKVPSVSFSFEAASQISYAGFYGIKGRFDLGIAYYFNKRLKDEQNN